MMKILITGGAGFIGSHLLELFAKKCTSNIIVLDNLSAGNHNVRLLKSLHVDLITGDITSKESLENLPRDIDTIIHLAAMNRAPRSIKDPLKSNIVNVNGTVNILELARRNDSRVIYICIKFLGFRASSYNTTS